MFGVIGAQVSRALRRDQHDRGAAAGKPGGQRDPGVAGRFHHYSHRYGAGHVGQPGPQALEVDDVSAEAVPAPEHATISSGQTGLVRRAAGDIHPERERHDTPQR